MILSDTDLADLVTRHDSDPHVLAAVREVRTLRADRDRLQTRCTELVHAERAARGILTLRWKRIGEHDLPIPARAHDTDAGLDLAVLVTGGEFPGHPLPVAGRFGANPERLVVFRTGWSVAIPTGWYGQIIVRSGIGKAGWDLESSGVVDAGFRGEILVPMVFRGDTLSSARYVEHGQRMAQMVLLPVPRVESVEADDLGTTARGAGGFGSTS